MKKLNIFCTFLLLGSYPFSAFSADSFQSSDDRLRAIAATEKSFSGLHRDAKGNLILSQNIAAPSLRLNMNNINQSENAQLSSLITALKTEFGNELFAQPNQKLSPSSNNSVINRAPAPHLANNIQLRQVNYSFAELYDWYQLIKQDLLDFSDVISSDIDEINNSLTITTLEDVDLSELKALIDNAGIPAGAVRFETSDPITSFATLRDKVRPMQGGLEVKMSSGGACSLGFNAKRANGEIGFVTSSHCTSNLAGPDTTWFYQGGSLIGKAGAETRYHPNLCGNGKCLTADIVFVPYPSHWKNYNQFKTSVLKTRASHDLNLKGGSSRYRTWWNLRTAGATPVVGDTVFKTGRTTGTTASKITATCVNFNVGSTRYICHTQTDNRRRFADRGDSGSAVLANTSYRYGRSAKIVGTITGGNGYRAYFSTLSAIENELGKLQVSYRDFKK